MVAYHNDPELKERFVALIREHEAADRIIQRTYWDNGDDGRGCAVGCSINSLRIITGRDLDRSDHAIYEELIGVPRILARLEDGIFEGLPIEEAQKWPARFAAAIRPGADLSMVWSRFAAWLLSDVMKFAKMDNQRKAINDVADLYRRWSEAGDKPTISEWRTAAAAAAAAAAYAAAAYAAADAAYAAAAAAAYAAAAAAYSTRQQARIVQADTLVELLTAA